MDAQMIVDLPFGYLPSVCGEGAATRETLLGLPVETCQAAADLPNVQKWDLGWTDARGNGPWCE